MKTVIKIIAGALSLVVSSPGSALEALSPYLMGSPRTILNAAHVPVVFTAVADPLDVDGLSHSDAGPGGTGATLYVDMSNSLKIVQQVFPLIKDIGMVHSDDVNGITQVQNARLSAQGLGIRVSSQMVDKTDSVTPALNALYKQGKGAQMFAVPLDTYYGLRNYEPTFALSRFGSENHVPMISFALVTVPAAAVYIGSDFEVIGALSGAQAVKILKERKSPDALAIVQQKEPTVLVNAERLAQLGITLPAAMAQRKLVRSDGYWQIPADK